MVAGLVAINLAAVIFGTAALFGKLALSPLWIVAARATFAALSLLLIGGLRGMLVRPTRAQLRTLFGSGVLLAVHWLTFFASVQGAGIAIATLTFATIPLFSLLLESLQTRRRPALAQLFASAVIVLAVSRLVQVGASEGELWGATAGLASALTFSLFGQVAKQLTRALPAVTVSAAQCVAVVLVTAPWLPLVQRAPGRASEWGCLLLLGVVTTALMHQLYLFALARLAASTCNAFVALEPVYAITFGAIWLNEPLTRAVALSGAAIVGASLLLLRYERPRDPIAAGP